MRRTLAIARAAMELSCLCAWSTMTLAMVGARRYPLPNALGAFASAVALTHFCSGHRARWRAPLQAAGGLLGVLYTLHELFAPAGPFLNLFWLPALASQAHVSYWTAAAFCAWTLALWIAGCRVALRSHAYPEVCAGFDRSILWLFALLFIKLLLRAQPEVWQTLDRSDALVLPCFVFGLAAVALARNQGDSQRAFMRGRRGVGVLVAFAGLVLAGGVGGTLLWLPYLHDASQASYAQLAAFAGPFGPVIVEIMLFFLSGRMLLPLPDKRPLVPVGSGSAPLDRSLTAAAAAGDDSTLFWLIAGAALCMGLLWWCVSRYRAAPTAERAQSWLARCRRWLRALLAGVARWLLQRRQDEAIRIYRALLGWGRRSGLPVRASDTPLEYGQRLQLRLGGVGAEIDAIVSLFNARVYGPELDRDGVRRAHVALRRLRSPRLWPRRVAAWLAAEAPR